MTERNRWLSLSIAALAAIGIGGTLIVLDGVTWVSIVAVLGIVGWIAATLLWEPRWRVPFIVAAAVAVVAGCLTATATGGLSLVPVVVGILLLFGRGDVRMSIGVGVTLAGVAALAIGGLVAPMPGWGLVVIAGWLLVGVLAGINRRAMRSAQADAADRREQESRLREEQRRVALARDLHDVLAHSLGGLTVQLDAVDALLEAGHIDQARERVRKARVLAGQGLADARGAVAALRAPAPSSDEPTDPMPGIDDLIAAHRSLGERVDLTVTGSARPVPAAVASALLRAVQESLSNARRHAPGAHTGVSLHWGADEIGLRVANDLTSEHAAPGGGYGLRGMRERFAALPFGGDVDAREVDGFFVVTARAGLEANGPGRASA
ncbi:sensor histidine kinase [Microbacterium gorillae]|uniref:sensor histidine kinase n=1 Tax=Microbacterium gorillae TaxID=1231063 RepID=UPI00058F75EA|nr:histidine kinase [Microbacterium gorillae]